jgi:hypothetical protein
MVLYDMRDNIRNPLLDVNEELSERPARNLSFFEKIGLFSALIISLFILIISVFSFHMDIFVKPNYTYALIDFFIILMCLWAMYFILNAIKRKIIIDILIDTAFQEGVYTRLKPLIENIARAHIDTEIILERMSNLDLKVQNILKEQYSKDIGTDGSMSKPIVVGTSIKFVIKSMFLIMITLIFFNLILNFNIGGITPMAVLLIFIIWWGFITAEYNLWKETTAWAAMFFPVLVVPVTIMLFTRLLAYNVLVAELYISVGFYTFIYYLWAVYVTTGSLPFILPEKKEHVTNEFFALQKKGILKEYLEALIKRLELLQKDKENQEIQLAWKK